MNKFLSFLLVLFSSLCFSQSIEDFDFENYTNPSPDNELSIYFKENIPKKLLRKVKLQPKKENIVISFYVTKENKPYKIRVNNFEDCQLKKTIINAFKAYTLEKITSKKLDPKAFYALQIISKKKNKPIINCSSKLVKILPPICNNCKDLEYYEDIKTCLNQEVTKHFYKNTDFTILENQQKNNLSLKINFTITKDGSLLNCSSKVPEIFKEEVYKTLKSFPKVKNTGSLENACHTIYIKYKKGKVPSIENYFKSVNGSIPKKIDERFAAYIETKLSNEDLLKADLNRVNNKLTISFKLNEDKQPYNIKTNSRSLILEEKIIEAFKNYPINDFKFSDTNKFNIYKIPVLIFNNNQIEIKPNELVLFKRIPIFPGCENSNDLQSARKCINTKVQKHFSQKFDFNIANRLGLSSGTKKILIQFKINKEGIINDIKVKSPHPEISNEVIRIMNLLPKVEPAVQNGKKVAIRFEIPFTLIVQ